MVRALRLLFPGTLLLPGLVLASPAAPPAIDSGDTAWMLTATALVLFMVIPGLALFYAGMVRAKNILSVLMQCFAITGLVSVAWVAYGYSLAFDTTGMQAGTVNLASFIGTLDNAFLANLTAPKPPSAGAANTPVSRAPTMPPTACTPNTSSESS